MGTGVQLHTVLLSAVDGFTPRPLYARVGCRQYPLNGRRGGPHRAGVVALESRKFLASAGNRTREAQVVS